MPGVISGVVFFLAAAASRRRLASAKMCVVQDLEAAGGPKSLENWPLALSVPVGTLLVRRRCGAEEGLICCVERATLAALPQLAAFRPSWVW